MTRGKRKTVWLVIALYAMTVCTGTGLHLLPGCGHPQQTFGGRLSQNVSAGDHYSTECSCDNEPSGAAGSSGPNHDADNCPICKFCRHSSYGGSIAAPVPSEPILCNAIRFFEPKASGSVGSSFLSRAPPAA
jgi:hypothetical protein